MAIVKCFPIKIGIIGKMCSGKTTLALEIQKHFNNFFITSFAKKIKEVAIELFNMDPQKKNRKLLQDIGTKMREIDKDIWIKYVLKESNNLDCVIIDDVRFENELEYLKKDNWFLVRLVLSDSEQLSRLKKTYPDSWEEHYNNINHVSESTNFDNEHFNLILNATDPLEDNIRSVIKNITNFSNK